MSATAVGAVIASGVAGVAYAGLVERNLFTLRRAAAPVLPAGARPVRVLQVSDLHLLPWQRRKIEWVRSLADLRPDFVVNTGDNLAHLEAVPPLLRAMEPLLESPGAFVLGSNDYFAPVLRNPGALPHPPPRPPAGGPTAPAGRRARRRARGRRLGEPQQRPDDGVDR